VKSKKKGGDGEILRGLEIMSQGSVFFKKMSEPVRLRVSNKKRRRKA
jgi:hypothetical protein